ncbi:MAG: hypothetical protein JXD18_13050 [Anaerolineae bacterium]|nr:hypothetical protein [Anaerolineae bacterium]
MKFETDELVLLGGERYRIRKRLGQGAVADVYLAAPTAVPDASVVVKVVRDDFSEDFSRIEAVRREGEVLALLNQAESPEWERANSLAARLQWARQTVLQRHIVALFDYGELGPEQPFVVQEAAPPAFELFAITSLDDERRMVSIASAIASVVSTTHRAGMALKDFEPRTKADRIRLQWIEPDKLDLKVIDWNITGDVADQTQDLFFLGQHLFYFFLGVHARLGQDGQPPARLGLGVPGWDQLTEGTRQILERLLHRDPQRRYQRADDIHADLAWWLETLRHTEASNPLGRLQDRFWHARPQGRHDRVLAISDLALRFDPPTEMRRSFEMWAGQAREELEKKTWEPIAFARGTLRTGAYGQAAEEFEQQTRILPPDSDSARLARIFYRLAQSGDRLKQQRHGIDIRKTSEWAALDRAATALINHRWIEVLQSVNELADLAPEMWDTPPVQAMSSLAQAGLLSQEAVDDIGQSEPRPAEALAPNWLEIEKAHIANVEIALQKLQQAQELAPLEPDIRDRLETERGRLQQRRRFFTQYGDADTSMGRGEAAFQQGRNSERLDNALAASQAYEDAAEAFRLALNTFEEILRVDPGQYRAQALRRRAESRLKESIDRQREMLELAQTRNQASDALEKAKGYCRQGEYGEALPLARQADRLNPGDPEAEAVLAEAQMANQYEHRARSIVENVRQLVWARDFEGAKNLLQQPLGWNNRLLTGLPGGESFNYAVVPLFRIREDLLAELNRLQRQIDRAQEARRQIEAAHPKGDYASILAALEEMETQGLRLTDEEGEWREEAQHRLALIGRAEEALKRTLAFEDLEGMIGLLKDDPNPRARSIVEECGRRWRTHVEVLTDFEQAKTLLDQGKQLFQGLPGAERLEQMALRVDQAVAVRRDVEAPAGQYPFWMGGVDFAETVRCLDVDLRVLTSIEESWATLREAAATWRNDLTGYLDRYVSDRIDADKKLIRERSSKEVFKEAVERARWLQQVVPESLRPPVWDELTKYAVELDARLAAEAAMRKLAQSLAANRSFVDASREAAGIRLPNHPDVPADDLRAFLADVKRAAEMERVLHDTPSADNYAVLMDKQRTMAAEQSPTFHLGDRQTDLQRELEQAVSKWEDLKHELEKATSRWAHQLGRALYEKDQQWKKNQLETDPLPLLRLYWQLVWWTTLESKSHPGLESLPTLRDRIADVLLRAGNTDDLLRARTILRHLIVLNRGLHQQRDAEGRPWIDLPPLPAGLQYPELKAALDSNALEDWEAEIDWLVEQGHAADRAVSRVPVEEARNNSVVDEAAGAEAHRGDATEATADDARPTQPMSTPYDPVAVKAAADAARRFDGHIKALNDVWTRLGLTPWRKDIALETSEQATEPAMEQMTEQATEQVPNHLALLEDEIGLHQTLAQSLEEVEVHYRRAEAMAGLQRLYERIETPAYLPRLKEFSLWLLKPQREVLLAAPESLRGQLVQALGGQVARILEERSTAVDRLQRDVLLVPQTGAIARSAREAIVRGVDELAEEARPDEVRALWKVVIDATAPAVGDVGGRFKRLPGGGRLSREKAQPEIRLQLPKVQHDESRPQATKPHMR